MKAFNHLNVFDFDETLFRVPSYASSEAAGLEPYEWFDSAISLNSTFPIRGISNTITRTEDPCFNILVTHRVAECRAEVFRLLGEKNIEFDQTFFLGRGSTKGETVISEIKRLDTKSVTIFEDSLWEIIQYTRAFLNEGLPDQKIEFIFVDKSKIIKIDWETAQSLEELSIIERLTIL